MPPDADRQCMNIISCCGEQEMKKGRMPFATECSMSACFSSASDCAKHHVDPAARKRLPITMHVISQTPKAFAVNRANFCERFQESRFANCPMHIFVAAALARTIWINPRLRPPLEKRRREPCSTR